MSRSASPIASAAPISTCLPAPSNASRASSSSAENFSGLLPRLRITVCSMRNSPLIAERAIRARRNPETSARKAAPSASIAAAGSAGRASVRPVPRKKAARRSSAEAVGAACAGKAGAGGGAASGGDGRGSVTCGTAAASAPTGAGGIAGRLCGAGSWSQSSGSSDRTTAGTECVLEMRRVIGLGGAGKGCFGRLGC